MQQDLPFCGEPEGLLRYLEDRLIGLNEGDLPERATVDQVAYVLSASTAGTVTRDGLAKALSLLRGLNVPGRVPWLDSGLTNQVLNTAFLGSFGPGKRLDTSGLTRSEPVFVLTLSDLKKLAPLIRLAGYVSPLVSMLIGTDATSNQQTPAASADDDLPDDLRGKTGVPLETARPLLGKYLAGGENFVRNQHRNRGATDGRAKPYLEAFNDDGTINCPKFYRVAKKRVELSGNGGAVALARVFHSAK